MPVNPGGLEAPAVEVVPYTGAHRDAAVGMMARLQDFEGTLHASRPPGPAMAAAHFDYLLDCCARQRGATFVAEIDGAAAGFVVAMVEAADAGDRHLLDAWKTYGMITDLYVDERFRRRGVADALVARAEEHLRGLGLATVRVSALAGNRMAGDFYHNCGYSAYEVTYLKAL